MDYMVVVAVVDMVLEVSAADLTGTGPHRSWRCGPDLGETRKTLHRGFKKIWKNHNKSL